MANYFTLTLDTTAPSNPSILIEANNTYATSRLVNLNISTGDSDTTGYQMKIWGDVDTANDSNIQDTEANSSWITYNTSQQVQLSNTDGQKSVYMKIRDDVYNVSAQASDSITLDTTRPVVTITGADVTKISKISGKNVASFSFTVSSTPESTYSAYKVKVVSTSGASHTTGTQIGTTNGSVNMNGSGSFDCSTPIECSINGTDLEIADSGDGQKIIKVFVQDNAGNWSA